MKNVKHPLSFLCFMMLTALFLSASANAQVFKANFALLSVASESPDKGVLIDLIKEIAKETGNQVEIKVYPFKRSLQNAIEHKADFHIPFIKSPYKPEDQLPFDYSTASLFDVNFILYTNKNKPIDTSNLAQYTITTDAAHVDLFDFPIKPDYQIESSLKKLNAGRIDGYIFADSEADPILKQLGLKNIRRQLYKVYDVHAVLPKGEKGKAADQMITKGMAILRQNGKWAKIIKPLDNEYVDWQP
ncbi:MAG: transporter substrate-binding domain-containing protein [Thermodesulfobacteriota bacterium]|nr:transporter substrate-binding domain-containing protein [Thermodesulfobacteriota bacterium]